MTSVLIIDDHPIVLQGCRRVLEDAGIAPVFVAGDVVTGYRLFEQHRPDVIVVDLAIKGAGLAGFALIRRIRSSDAKARILVLSMHDDAGMVTRSLEVGALGYVLKDTSSEELVKAVGQVASGSRFLSGDLAVKVALAGASARGKLLADLTLRELQVLTLLADGMSYDRIAAELKVSYKTVVNVSSQLRQKLQAGNLAELVSTAVKMLTVQG